MKKATRPLSRAKEDGDPAIVWGGGILVRNLNAVLSRRFIEAMKSGDKELFAPFKGRCFASLGDVAQFIQQTVDDRKIEALLRGLMLLDWQKVSREHVAELRGAGRPLPHAAYALLKLCHLPHALEDKAIKLSPQITRRALAGDAVGATQLAARRLLASGFPPAVQQVNCPREQILRTCAAVLFPISRTSESKLAEVILAKHKRPEPDPESKLDSLSAT